MKHMIIVKANESAPAREEFAKAAEEVFKTITNIDGVHSLRVRLGLPMAANRYDFIVEIDMDKEALPAYNDSPEHHLWKEKYGGWIEKKAIFDTED